MGSVPVFGLYQSGLTLGSAVHHLDRQSIERHCLASFELSQPALVLAK